MNVSRTLVLGGVQGADERFPGRDAEHLVGGGRCVSTVLTLKNSCWAIARLVVAEAASSEICRCRDVSDASPSVCARRGRRPLAINSRRARSANSFAPIR